MFTAVKTSALPVIGWRASTLLVGERRVVRNTAKVITAITPAKANKNHIDGLNVELVGAGRALLFFFCFMNAFEQSAKRAMDR
jgi:hypothetical protein